MAIEYLPGNRLTLLRSGKEYFPALLSAIAAARREINLESYIFADDMIGRAVSRALQAAARRGVTVRVLVDGFGAAAFATEFRPELTAAGVQAMLYRPELARFRFRRYRLRRLHRKLVTIDARVAFIGGINIVDDDNAPADLGPRFDFAVRLEGPTLAPIHAAMVRMWEIVSWVNMKRRYRLKKPLQPSMRARGKQAAAYLARGNILHRNDIADAYLEAIDAATDEILIANAYFLPGFRFRHALKSAARRGVNVIVLLQGRSDHMLLHYATQALYGAMLDEGIRVFEYRKSFLHAKVAVIDGEWATVGSSNIDPFSLFLAKEANMAVRDRKFAGELRASLIAALADGGVELRREDLKRLTWHSRFRRWVSYGLVRLLVGLAGYGPRHWRSDEEKPQE